MILQHINIQVTLFCFRIQWQFNVESSDTIQPCPEAKSRHPQVTSLSCR